MLKVYTIGEVDKIVIIDDKEVDYKKELIDDLVTIATSFLARIYRAMEGKKLTSIIKKLKEERGADFEDYNESTSN